MGLEAWCWGDLLVFPAEHCHGIRCLVPRIGSGRQELEINSGIQNCHIWWIFRTRTCARTNYRNVLIGEILGAWRRASETGLWLAPGYSASRQGRLRTFWYVEYESYGLKLFLSSLSRLWKWITHRSLSGSHSGHSACDAKPSPFGYMPPVPITCHIAEGVVGVSMRSIVY